MLPYEITKSECGNYRSLRETDLDFSFVCVGWRWDNNEFSVETRATLECSSWLAVMKCLCIVVAGGYSESLNCTEMAKFHRKWLIKCCVKKETMCSTFVVVVVVVEINKFHCKFDAYFSHTFATSFRIIAPDLRQSKIIFICKNRPILVS